MYRGEPLPTEDKPKGLALARDAYSTTESPGTIYNSKVHASCRQHKCTADWAQNLQMALHQCAHTGATACCSARPAAAGSSSWPGELPHCSRQCTCNAADDRLSHGRIACGGLCTNKSGRLNRGPAITATHPQDNTTLATQHAHTLQNHNTHCCCPPSVHIECEPMPSLYIPPGQWVLCSLLDKLFAKISLDRHERCHTQKSENTPAGCTEQQQRRIRSNPAHLPHCTPHSFPH